MKKVTCNKCKHELHTCTPDLWIGSVHVGCGGIYIQESVKRINNKIKESGGIVYNDEVISLEKFTCNTCDIMENCRYAWDLYNISGDCLAEK